MKPNCVFIRVDKKYVRLKFDELIYAASQRNHIILHCLESTLVTKMCLSDLEALLPAEFFCRIHRSFIVNIEEILWFDSASAAVGKFILPIGDLYKNELMRRVMHAQ